MARVNASGLVGSRSPNLWLSSSSTSLMPTSRSPSLRMNSRATATRASKGTDIFWSNLRGLSPQLFGVDRDGSCRRIGSCYWLCLLCSRPRREVLVIEDEGETLAEESTGNADARFTEQISRMALMSSSDSTHLRPIFFAGNRPLRKL